nr:hypothetical protein [uncultured Sellimonas sp.]
MTREEKQIKTYVNSIEKHLRLPLELKARINSDIGTEIHMKLEAGKTVDEILEEMGTPKEVAERFNQELFDQQIRRNPLRFLFLLLAVWGSIKIIYNLITHTWNGALFNFSISSVSLVLSFLSAYFLSYYGKKATPSRYKKSIYLSLIGIVLEIIGICFFSYSSEGWLQWGFSFGTSSSLGNPGLVISPGFVFNFILLIIVHKWKKANKE